MTKKHFKDEKTKWDIICCLDTELEDGMAEMILSRNDADASRRALN